MSNTYNSLVNCPASNGCGQQSDKNISIDEAMIKFKGKGEPNLTMEKFGELVGQRTAKNRIWKQHARGSTSLVSLVCITTKVCTCGRLYHAT